MGKSLGFIDKKVEKFQREEKLGEFDSFQRWYYDIYPVLTYRQMSQVAQ